MFGFNSTRPDFDTFGRDWPNRETSRFVEAGGLRFHVQIAGREDTPVVLLLHGTGASTHSFRQSLPLIAERFRVVSPDLPGHGFTETPRPSGFTLPGMAGAVGALCKRLGVSPDFVVGHSAGTAIALQMLSTRQIEPRVTIGFNSALEPMEGNTLLSPIAKLLFLNPMVPKLVSWHARHGGMAGTLLDRTGSRLDATGSSLYARLFNESAHVAGALGMMAHWELRPLRRRFADIRSAVLLVAAGDDAMVPAKVSREAAGHLVNTRYMEVPDGGHLLHEVQPDLIVSLLDAESRAGACPSDTAARHSA